MSFSDASGSAWGRSYSHDRDRDRGGVGGAPQYTEGGFFDTPQYTTQYTSPPHVQSSMYPLPQYGQAARPPSSAQKRRPEGGEHQLVRFEDGLHRNGAEPSMNRRPIDEDAPPTVSLLDSRDFMTSPMFTRTEMARNHTLGLRQRKAPVPSTDEWAEWMIVFGFPPEAESAVVREFQAFGRIVEQKQGQGNWLLLRYATPLQAEKALACGNGLRLLNGHVIVGTRKLDARSAQEVTIAPSTRPPVPLFGADTSSARREEKEGEPVGSERRTGLGALKPSTAWSTFTAPVSSQLRGGAANDIDDSDLLEELPRRDGNICQRIMSRIMSIRFD